MSETERRERVAREWDGLLDALRDMIGLADAYHRWWRYARPGEVYDPNGMIPRARAALARAEGASMAEPVAWIPYAVDDDLPTREAGMLIRRGQLTAFATEDEAAAYLDQLPPGASYFAAYAAPPPPEGPEPARMCVCGHAESEHRMTYYPKESNTCRHGGIIEPEDVGWQCECVEFRAVEPAGVVEQAEGQRGLVCHHCGAPGSCFGMYEGDTVGYVACDDCCGHGNGDGWCVGGEEIVEALREHYAEPRTPPDTESPEPRRYTRDEIAAELEAEAARVLDPASIDFRDDSWMERALRGNGMRTAARWLRTDTRTHEERDDD
jgi:hypothetical protein